MINALRVNLDRTMAGASPGGRLRFNASFLFVAVLWGALLAFGGAGADYPLITMSLEIFAVFISFRVIFSVTSGQVPLPQNMAIPAILAGLIMALPLIQLLPLPPSIWEALPGRERAAAIFATQGWGDRWMPLSLDPDATKRAALSLLPGLAMFFGTSLLSGEDRIRLAAILLAFALFGAGLGALQVATGGEMTPFDSVHRGHALGLFTNRNHQAIFLLIALLVGAAIMPDGRRDRRHQAEQRWIAAGVGCLLIAGVLATKSRSGATLLLATLPVAAILFGVLQLRWKSVGALGAAGALLLIVFNVSSTAQDLLARFQSPDDDRTTFWANTILAIKQHSLRGSGFGTFPTIYRTVEPLGDLTSGYVNHAHCDYLELLLEGGLPAMGLVALGLGWIIWRAGKLLRAGRASSNGKLAMAALFGLLVLLLHSVVDYPLRMLSLEAVFGFLCALLLPPARERATDQRDRRLP